MSDAYAYVAKGKLKLKCDSELKKKKKHKHKDKKTDLEELQKSYAEQQIAEASSATSSVAYERKLTKAEVASKKQQEKMRNKRIMEKAQTTHKQRVEKFNEHLDTLTEHFDIPKVSWTK
ncbi:protein FAM32A-like [Scaptodrosophila lebanonensis]|uniref:Protein FAM32A-like n=1 Tax=Drosophila lebanonensis TaxID=7225 RepID=A0A6J2U3J1_DROLE|nr:protein FAM32A-like [Scaptodrosophila lebanonensis]